MHFVYEIIDINGERITEVYYLPKGAAYDQKQIVADFTDHSAGAFAFACFCEALARKGGSLRDSTGKYLVGSIGDLVGA
jgi:hypothetical protein